MNVRHMLASVAIVLLSLASASAHTNKGADSLRLVNRFRWSKENTRRRSMPGERNGLLHMEAKPRDERVGAGAKATITERPFLAPLPRHR